MPFEFASCSLNLTTFGLRRRGRVIKLEPEVCDALAHWIKRRDRVDTKIELLDSLWPGEAVSDSVLPRCITAARRAIGGGTQAKQRAIQTLHGRGYRAVATLEGSVERPKKKDNARFC
jgi:DNA-binding winged helix-turn-helix (wHTH) protein